MEPQALEHEYGTLTPKEIEVTRLICNGTSRRKIAERMHCSPKTIDAHRDNIKLKMGLGTGIKRSDFPKMLYQRARNQISIAHSYKGYPDIPEMDDTVTATESPAERDGEQA